MLEGIIYYIKEAVAPKGYKLDTTVYVLCDSEDDLAKAEALLANDNSVSKSGTRYAGAVNSEKPLEIRIVNTREEIPNPPPVVPPVPGNPADPAAEDEEIDEDEVPLAGGFRNMNEGDCMN